MIPALFAEIPVLHLARADYARTGLAWSVFVAPATLTDAVRRLYEAQYALEDLTAIDAAEGYVLVYHFENMDAPGRVALRVLIGHETPEVPSIAAIFQGAEWHERETTDFYGIVFAGNPNPVPLLLPDDMTERPLRKDASKRSAASVLIPEGEVLRKADDFALFPPPPPADAPAAQA